MSSSTSLLDLLVQSQASKEVTANALFNASSPCMFAARRESACSGLTWGYYGGWVCRSDSIISQIPNGTLSLTASATNRIYLKLDGTIGVTTGGAAADELVILFNVVTGASTVTSYEDYRVAIVPPWLVTKASVDVAAGDVTLSSTARRASYLTVTGALTVSRNVIVPNEWSGYVYINTTGAYTITIKTLAGTGIVVAQGKRAILLADGTNVVRITGDT